MILVRAPLRMSFLGGGTDLPDFYKRRPGRVISTAIDKYVYVAVNRTPMIDKVSARYSTSETVDHPKYLLHSRIRAALEHLGIEKGIEVASFASVPAKTGLGSSSSFSVALMKALHAYLGKKIDAHEAAQAAAHLEIELLKEPIGPQDQYAAAFGGFNVFQFNPDGTVDVDPVLLDYQTRFKIQDHLLLFFTGLIRAASSVLTEQKANIDAKFQTLSEMADSVPEFKTRVLTGDVRGMAAMLHDGWMKKKSLASNVSNSTIDDLYQTGLSNGAWGGKILGAGGGGCILFLVPPEKRPQVKQAMEQYMTVKNLTDFKEIPVHFVQSGAEVVYHGDYKHGGFGNGSGPVVTLA